MGVKGTATPASWRVPILDAARDVLPDPSQETDERRNRLNGNNDEG